MVTSDFQIPYVLFLEGCFVFTRQQLIDVIRRKRYLIKRYRSIKSSSIINDTKFFNSTNSF